MYVDCISLWGRDLRDSLCFSNSPTNNYCSKWDWCLTQVPLPLRSWVKDCSDSATSVYSWLFAKSNKCQKSSFSTLINVSVCLHRTLSAKMMAATWMVSAQSLSVHTMTTRWSTNRYCIGLDIVIHHHGFGRSFVFCIFFFTLQDYIWKTNPPFTVFFFQCVF